MTRFLLPTHAGLEPFVQQDALALGATKAECLVGRVVAEGDLDFLYRANLAHPTAERVHVVLAEGPVATPEDCAALAKQVDWPTLMRAGQTFAVDCLRVGEHAWTSQDVERKVGAAIVAATGAKANLRAPDVEVHVHVRDAHAYVAVNTTGAPLHERPWRAYAHHAPLNACIASALVAWSGWVERGGTLLDPTTGSGTIAIEADARGRGRAVNLGRPTWAFQRLGLHDEERYHALRDELACAARDEGPPIVANELNPKHLDGARENGRRAAARVGWSLSDFNLLARPEGLSTVIANPPWGLRMTSRKVSDRIAAELRAKLLQWRPPSAVVLVGNRRFEQHEPLPVEARGLMYGGTYCRMLRYAL